MPYRYVEPDVYLEHNDVTVWYGYPDPNEGPSEYWFTTKEKTADDFHGHGSNGWFDARLLTGKWSETPTVGQWDDWWKPRFRTEAEAVEALVKTAIEESRLPHVERAA